MSVGIVTPVYRRVNRLISQDAIRIQQFTLTENARDFAKMLIALRNRNPYAESVKVAILEIEKREFLENAINMLLECENRGVHIRWILERFYPTPWRQTPAASKRKTKNPKPSPASPKNSSNYSANPPATSSTSKTKTS